MIQTKMELTQDEKDILNGKQGETRQKILESVVLYGEVFGAKKLVPLNGPVHLVTSFGIPILTPIFEMMNELIANDIKSKKPFTVNPRPLDSDHVKCNILQKLVFKIMYGKQEEYEAQLHKVGLKDENAFTCTCYQPEVGNTPAKGEVLAWAESSAVVYANSVLGARSNRNSGIIELFCGILGKAPEFGLLTDDGRIAKWLVEVKTSKVPNAQVLGSAIGMKVVEDVPYITGLDRFLGSGLSPDTCDYLKDMGAAGASNGAVGLYHVEHITPEAVDRQRSLLAENYRTYVIDDQELDRVINSYPLMWKKREVKPKVCFIGCPHLSLKQLEDWSEKVISLLKSMGRRRVGIPTLLCAAPDVVKVFKEDKTKYNRLFETGVQITSICPLMYMNNPLCAKQPVITNSNKLRTYTTAKFLPDDEILKEIINW